MNKGCEYCTNHKNLLYYNDIDGEGGGCEITLGIDSDGWYLEVNTRSTRTGGEKVAVGSLPPAEINGMDKTPANYCPVCGNQLKELEE